RGGPRECIAPSTAHTDKGGRFGEPMLFCEKRVPGIPVLHVIGLNEADVKATLEQLDLSLWLVVEVAASPGPRLARSHPLRNDHDTAQLPLHLAPDTGSFVAGSLDWLDRQCRIVHQEVEAVEPVPRRLLASETRGRLASDTVELLAEDILIN